MYSRIKAEYELPAISHTNAKAHGVNMSFIDPMFSAYSDFLDPAVRVPCERSNTTITSLLVSDEDFAGPLVSAIELSLSFGYLRSRIFPTERFFTALG